MSTILDTVVEYEDRVVDLVASTKDPVAEYVTKGVELVGERLPEVSYPEALPTPIELLDTQVAFAKKLLDAQASVSRAVLEAIAPVAGYKTPVKRTTKAATKAA
jgi:hypothetical protein